MTTFIHPKPEEFDSERTRAGKLRRKLVEAGGIAYPVDDYDVPMLMPELQATSLQLPCDAWGSRPRKRFQTKTFHFYQDDYKFVDLFSNPMALVVLEPRAAIEVNCSTDLNTPLAYLLGVIYAKRWLSRTWQAEGGIKIWVDVNFAPEQADLQLLGVPKGWRAYATQGIANNFNLTKAQWEMACERAKTKDILFTVVGGGKKIKEQAAKRGWIWCPSVHERITGKFED